MSKYFEIPREHVYFGHDWDDERKVKIPRTLGWFYVPMHKAIKTDGTVYKNVRENMTEAWRHYSNLGYDPKDILSMLRHTHTNYNKYMVTNESAPNGVRGFATIINRSFGYNHCARRYLRKWLSYKRMRGGPQIREMMKKIDLWESGQGRNNSPRKPTGRQ